MCLPSASDRFYGMASVATGWGIINSTVNDDPDSINAEVLQVSLDLSLRSLLIICFDRKSSCQYNLKPFAINTSTLNLWPHPLVINGQCSSVSEMGWQIG